MRDFAWHGATVDPKSSVWSSLARRRARANGVAGEHGREPRGRAIDSI